MPLAALLTILGGMAAVDVVERARLARRPATAPLVLAHAAFDLVSLTGILLVTA